MTRCLASAKNSQRSTIAPSSALTAAIIQGYRTRDAAFRIFRNEKLERYKSLFDLAAQYTFMAAKAYDYETGLLGTDQGKAFIARIINSRALGVVRIHAPHDAQQHQHGHKGGHGLKFLHFQISILSKSSR